MALSPEHRAVLLAIRDQLRSQAVRLEKEIMLEESRELAVAERIGRPAEDGMAVTAADEIRAREIVQQFWKVGLE